MCVCFKRLLMVYTTLANLVSIMRINAKATPTNHTHYSSYVYNSCRACLVTHMGPYHDTLCHTHTETNTHTHVAAFLFIRSEPIELSFLLCVSCMHGISLFNNCHFIVILLYFLNEHLFVSFLPPFDLELWQTDCCNNCTFKLKESAKALINGIFHAHSYPQGHQRNVRLQCRGVSRIFVMGFPSVRIYRNIALISC